MMDLFRELNIPNEKLHEKFIRLRDSFQFEGHRQIISSWAEGFVDRDNKIIHQFQTTFHSCFWELYLHQLFKVEIPHYLTTSFRVMQKL